MDGMPVKPRGWWNTPWYRASQSCLHVAALYATVTSLRRPVCVLAVTPVTYTTALSGLAATDVAVADRCAPPNRCTQTWVPPGTAAARWPAPATAGAATAQTPVAATAMAA